MAKRAEARTGRLWVRVVIGLLVGALYTALDAWLDMRAGVPRGGPSGVFATFHELVDLVMPIATGGLVGVALHHLRVRAAATLAERTRAEELRGHLHKVERDQAVWVVAASILHEVKNPLHTLGLLLDEASALGEDEAAERASLLTRARAQCDRAVDQLGALRSLPGATAPELPKLPLSATVRRLVEGLQPLCEDDPVRLAVHDPAPVAVRADPVYLQIIVENLVENALDAIRERGGAGAIDVEIAQRDGLALVRVSDDGAGIDAEVAASLFEPLHTTKTRGLGLGLPIARALARAMRGDLSLEPGPRTTFRLELTLEAP